MIISDKDAATRLNSPMNLINRLKSASNGKNKPMSLFGVGRQPLPVLAAEIIPKAKILFNPFIQATPIQEIASEHPQPPSLDNLLDSGDSQIKLSLAHDTALDVLTKSVEMMRTKLDDIKADKLPSVITATSRVVESIRKERNEANKNSVGRDVHYHFYTPEQKKLTDYEVIEVQ